MTIAWIQQPETAAPAPKIPPESGISIDWAGSVPAALARLDTNGADALVAVFPAGQWSPDAVLDEARRIRAGLPVIIFDPEGTVEDAVRLTKLGADYFLSVWPEPERLEGILRSAAARGRRAADPVRAEPWRQLLVGRSEAIERVVRVVRLVASRRCTVLIQGETGTGKEVVARAIHAASNRSNLELVAVNCNALPENLLEDELFGHIKGAFTGAIQNRVGRFEQANRGTLFLDEIGDLPMDIQAKLLRVLQEREFQRIGSSETIRVDARVVAATNVDIAAQIRNGKFREDLYYRLNVVPILVPALRERREDIPLLVEHFIEKICRAEDIPGKGITQEAMDRLTLFDWPGNVRQVENAVEMAVALSGDRGTLELADFPLPAGNGWRNDSEATPVVAVPDGGIDFEKVIDRIERDLIAQALRRTNGNKKQAADILRLKRTTFTAKMKSLEAVASY